MSKWNTGTPPKGQTEDIYALCIWFDGWWLSDYLFKANHKDGCFETVALIDGRQAAFKFSDLVAWQKIEPYNNKSCKAYNCLVCERHDECKPICTLD